MIFLASAEEKIALTILIVCIVAIGALIIAALVLRIRAARKQEIKRLENLETKEVTPEEKEEFLLAYGGADNIEDVKLERNKIIAFVKEVEKVNGDALKTLGATNVLIIGNEVRSSFEDRAEYVIKILK